MSNSLWPHGLQPTRLLCPWDVPGKNTGVGCHFLLQGILPTQGSNPHLLHWQVDSLPYEPPGKPLLFHTCMCTRAHTRVCVCVCVYSYDVSKNHWVLIAQSCPTLCDPMNCNSPGSSVHKILQARILQWVAMPFSGGSSQPRGWTWVSCMADRFHLNHQGSPQTTEKPN